MNGGVFIGTAPKGGYGHFAGKLDTASGANYFTWFTFTTYSTNESLSQLKIQRKIKIKSIYVNVSANSCDEVTPITLYDDGVATAATVTVTAASGEEEQELTGLNIIIAAGSKLSLNVDTSSSTGGDAITAQWIIEFEYM